MTKKEKMSKCNPITRIIPASFAWIILLFSTGAFFAFPCRYLMSVYSIAIPVFQSIVTFFVTVNFGLATFVNPGAIPKAASDEIKNAVSSPTYQDIDIRGVRVRLKWCVTCQFFRPPRCVHCGVCDTCIETFDHHCPWVNNCIGRRNYRYFFMFLLWLTIHMISILSLCTLYMKDHLNNVRSLETIMTLSVIGIIILLFIPIFGLTGFHIMLITQGLTTNEQVTGKFLDVRSPYNKGCLKNVLYSLCNSPVPRYQKCSSSRHPDKKYIKETKTPEGNETSHSDKFLTVQYQFVGKSDCMLKQNETFECEQPSGSSLLNRGSLHLSLNESFYSRQMDSVSKRKISRTLTPPVPVRFDYSRRSLPPLNKFHSSNPGYFIDPKDVPKTRYEQSPMFTDSPEQNSSAQEFDYTVAIPDASYIYPRIHKSHDALPGDRYTYTVHTSNNTGKVLASDTCCLGNQTVDKLQELANRSMMSGQCTDMSVLEVFPKACSSFQTTPSKDLHDGQQLLVAQTPLYLNNCVEYQQVGASHPCQPNVPSDFIRTPGNRPLSFVKAMEMSETLDWNDEHCKASNNLLHFKLPTNVLSYSVAAIDSAQISEQKNDHEISYEISV